MGFCSFYPDDDGQAPTDAICDTFTVSDKTSGKGKDCKSFVHPTGKPGHASENIVDRESLMINVFTNTSFPVAVRATFSSIQFKHLGVYHPKYKE